MPRGAQAPSSVTFSSKASAWTRGSGKAPGEANASRATLRKGCQLSRVFGTLELDGVLCAHQTVGMRMRTQARPLPVGARHQRQPPLESPARTKISRSVIARFIGEDGVRLWRGVQEAIRKYYGLERMREVRKTVRQARRARTGQRRNARQRRGTPPSRLPPAVATTAPAIGATLSPLSRRSSGWPGRRRFCTLAARSKWQTWQASTSH